MVHTVCGPFSRWLILVRGRQNWLCHVFVVGHASTLVRFVSRDSEGPTTGSSNMEFCHGKVWFQVIKDVWNPSQLLVIWLSKKEPKTGRATAPNHRSSSKIVHCWWFLKAPLENRFETCNCSNFRQGIKLGSQSSRPWLLELASNFTVNVNFVINCCDIPGPESATEF